MFGKRGVELTTLEVFGPVISLWIGMSVAMMTKDPVMEMLTMALAFILLVTAAVAVMLELL